MIDAHIHCSGYDGRLLALLAEVDGKILNVAVPTTEWDWRAEVAAYRRMAEADPARFAWCTGLELPDFSADWAERAMALLDEDVAAGAVGVKIWKNIGMDVRRPDGAFLQIDDEIFAPVFEHLARIGLPVLLHLAEPQACWLPLDSANPHYGYYSQHPEWHLYGRDDVPGHAEITAARDRVVDRHRDVRFIGAHLASLEYDLGEIARRLDDWPHFAIDTSARLGDLARFESSAVREFLLRYADRVLFGTDVGIGAPSVDDEQYDAFIGRYRERLDRSRRYFATGETLEIVGCRTPGLALPADVAEKIMDTNVRRWYPGV